MRRVRLLVAVILAAVLAILAVVGAPILAQLVAALAALLLVSPLLGEVRLEGRPVRREFGLVGRNGRLVMRSAVLGELLAIVEHLFVSSLHLGLVGVDCLDVALYLVLVSRDLLIRSVVVLSAHAVREDKQAGDDTKQHFAHHGFLRRRPGGRLPERRPAIPSLG